MKPKTIEGKLLFLKSCNRKLFNDRERAEEKIHQKIKKKI